MYPQAEAILIVDPDDARREVLATILRDEAFQVTAVTEGLGALRLVRKQDFALVVAAIRLPGTLDGITTMRQARLRRPGLKFLLVAEYADLPRWRTPEWDDVIAAPFHRWELAGCVFELIQRQGAAETTDLARRCRTALLAS